MAARYELVDRVNDDSTMEEWIRRELDVARSRPYMRLGYRVQAPVEHRTVIDSSPKYFLCASANPAGNEAYESFPRN